MTRSILIPILLLGLCAGCNSGSSRSSNATAAASTTQSTASPTTSFGTVLNDDHADQAAGATPVPLITTGLVLNAGFARGVIDAPNDQDWFEVRLDGRVPFLIEVDTQGDSSMLLLASDGATLLTSNEDVDTAAGRLDSAVRFVPSRTDTFYVVVQKGANATALPDYGLSVRQTN